MLFQFSKYPSNNNKYNIIKYNLKYFDVPKSQGQGATILQTFDSSCITSYVYN